MTFYATPATRRGLDRAEEVHREGRRRGLQAGAVGAGPYKFASFNPGVELVLDAHDRYWRKTPAVKRHGVARGDRGHHALAMLKRGEVDVAYSLRGPLGEEVSARPGSS